MHWGWLFSHAHLCLQLNLLSALDDPLYQPSLASFVPFLAKHRQAGEEGLVPSSVRQPVLVIRPDPLLPR